VESELRSQIAAVRRAADIGCFGAHQISNGEWLPCSSTKQFLTITNGFDVKSRISLDDMENWSSIRKSKGKKRKKRWEKLRERRVLGIESLEGGGLVSPRNSTNMINGGTNPPITHGASSPSGMSTKSIQPAFMPRDNDPDVFVDIESARKRAQQLGCIGVSRRMSKGGKVIWMPCTNITDYNNLTGMTSLGRTNLQKRNEKIVRTVIKENLKKKKTTIQEDIYGKALGPRIRGIARAAMGRFDPNAFDGDEDGLIQDGTAFERPSIPTPSIPKPADREATPKTVDREVSASEVSAVRKFMSAMTSSQMDSFRGEPIEAYDGVPGSRRGMASSGPGFIIGRGPKPVSGRKTPKPLSIAELRNPEASPTNPFRNLGGRLMGKLIRGMVKPEHRNKQDRTTFLIGGNTGSGKTTVLDGHLIPKGLVPSHEEAALIDPDFIKKGLVGYNDGDGAGRVHRESQAATDKTIRDAASDQMDMVITGSGASRQIQHMREASERGEKVVGHWVHVPQQEASRRIKKRMDETNRYIPDNTAHMAQSIPKVISTGFEEDLLDEFYLWDNDVPEGKEPKLIAKKVRGKKFEIYDAKKFEEFAGSKKWADTWVATSEGKDSDNDSASVQMSKNRSGNPANRGGGRVTQKPGTSTRIPTTMPGMTVNIPGITPNMPGAITPLPAGGPMDLSNAGPVSREDRAKKILKKIMGDAVRELKAASSQALKDVLINPIQGMPLYKEADENQIRIDLKSLQINLDTPEDILKAVDTYAPFKADNESMEDFAARIIQTIPAMRWAARAQGPDGAKQLAEMLTKSGFSNDAQKKVREILKKNLENKSFAELVKIHGMPLIVNGDKYFLDEVDLNRMGIAALHTSGYGVIVMAHDPLKEGKSKAMGWTDNNPLYDYVEGTMRHEWFHYFDGIMNAIDPVARQNRAQKYIDSLTDFLSDPEARFYKAMGSKEEMIKQAEEILIKSLAFTNNMPRKRAREYLRNMSEQDYEENIDLAITNLMMDAIESLGKDRAGVYDDVAKKYSVYARHGMHELIAEIGKLITTTPDERGLSRTNTDYAVDSETIDFLMEMFPSISRGLWVSIIKTSYPKIQIKVLR
jgi:predicted ABC-type ATPase